MHMNKSGISIAVLLVITCFYASLAEVMVKRSAAISIPHSDVTKLKSPITELYQVDNYSLNFDNLLNVNPLIQVDTILHDTICFGDSLVLTAADNMQSYLWSNDSTTQSIQVFPIESTFYWVEMIDQNDSTFRDTTYVVVNPIPLILGSSNDTLSIDAGTDTIVWVDVETNATILWNTGSTEPQIVVSPTTNTTYSVVITNASGCSIRKSFLVEVNYFVNIAFTYDTVCEKGITTLINTTLTNDSITYILWDLNSDGQFNDAEGDTVNHVFDTSGNHLVGMRVYFMASPMNATYNAVPVGSLPRVDFEYENTCQNTTTFFTSLTVVTTGIENQWFWQFGDGKTDVFQNTSNFYVNQGSYDVQLKVWTNIGCFDSIIKPVTIYGLPEFAFLIGDSLIGNDDTTYFAKGSTLIVSVDVDVTANYDSVVWYDGSTELAISITTAGIYDATVYYKGCSNTLRFVALNKGNAGAGTEIMNLFTPNGDGFNDVWLVNNPSVTFPIKVTIYSRGGQSVYASESYQNDWDGQSKGNPLPQATYYYVIQDAQGMSFKGPITIIR